jgi:hypothetical protein
MPRVIGDVAQLPGIGREVIQLEPRTRGLEQRPLRRGEAAGPGESAQREERRARADIGRGAEGSAVYASVRISLKPAVRTERWCSSQSCQLRSLKTWVRPACDDGAVSRVRNLRPCIPRGGATPARSRIVEVRSTVLTRPRSQTEPASIILGRERMRGVRVPESYRVPFSWGNGAPLSLRKTISVFSRSFRRSSSASMVPIARSLRAMAS